MTLIQKNGSDNDLSLSATGDDHIIEVVQDGFNNSADITSAGDYPNDITVNQTGDNFGVIINQYCVTPTANGYCHVSVTQN